MTKGEKIRADFMTAAALLDDDNLVWSADLDSIRKDLAEYLRVMAGLGSGNHPHLVQVVETLVDAENDISIGD